MFSLCVRVCGWVWGVGWFRRLPCNTDTAIADARDIADCLGRCAVFSSPSFERGIATARCPFTLRDHCVFFLLLFHQPPIVHRDMKSPNILLADPSGDSPVMAKVCDFGLSTQFSFVFDDTKVGFFWMPITCSVSVLLLLRNIKGCGQSAVECA